MEEQKRKIISSPDPFCPCKLNSSPRRLNGVVDAMTLPASFDTEAVASHMCDLKCLSVEILNAFFYTAQTEK